MKKTLLLLPLLVLAACSSKNEPEKIYYTIAFEDISFDAGKHNNYPSDSGTAAYSEFGADFEVTNYYTQTGGILVADNCEKPVIDSEYYHNASDKCVVNNDYVKPEKGENEKAEYGADGSANYSVWAYNSYVSKDVPQFSFTTGVTRKIVSLKVNNVAQYWQRMKIGFYSKPGLSDGDYFEAVFTGYDEAGNETASVVVPMADFRDGRTFLMESWTEVDLSALGNVNKVGLTASYSTAFSELFTGESYAVCVDNIKFDVTAD